MTVAEGSDAGIARALVARGVVSERAVAHARAVRERSTPGPLAELLVDLEHADAGAVVEALSAITGAPRWDGRGLEVVPRADDARAHAAIVRRDGKRVLYATLSPEDELEREDARFSTGATSAEPMVALPEEIARARAASGPLRRLPELTHILAADRRFDRALGADEARFRGESEGEHESPAVRLANAIALDLLFYCPGATARLDLGDHPALRVGHGATLDVELDLGVDPAATRSILQRISWRYAAMAGLPVGRDRRQGWVLVRSARRSGSFLVAFEPTERGPVVLLARQTHWAGAGPPPSPRWDGVRAAIDHVDAAEDDDARLAALTELERVAAALGPDAAIEAALAAWDAGVLLDRALREDEATRTLERVRALLAEIGASPRVHGELLTALASAEVQDLGRRAALYAEAETLQRAAGRARFVTTGVTLDLATSLRLVGAAEDASAAAERGADEDRRWLGGLGHVGVFCMFEATLCRAALGDAAGADRAAEVVASVATAVGVPPFYGDWARGEAALVAGRFDAALARSERALDLFEQPWSSDAGDAPLHLVRSRALEGLGRTTESSSAAARGLASLGRDVGPTRRLRADLERAARPRSPYR